MTTAARMVPSLLVEDFDRTLAFYGRLGFEQTGRWPDEGEAEWTEVQREGMTLWFYTRPPRGTPSAPSLSGTLYFFPGDVRALAREWADAVDFAWGPEVMPYGLREFAVKDPDGYLLAFAEPE